MNTFTKRCFGFRPVAVVLASAALVFFTAGPVQAQRHRATRLGDPASRFAPPLTRPEQLRTLLLDPKLKADVDSILRQADWKGNPEDLRHAAATAPITELKLPTGSRLPYMSSRKSGHPVALIDVLWEGPQPIEAYAFEFYSKGRRYRCVTPKPCSNFFTVDLGPDPAPVLAIECSVREESLVGRPVEVCLTVRNSGDAPEPRTTVTLPIPPGSVVTNANEEGTSADGRVVWEIPNLAPQSSKRVCAILEVREPVSLSFAAVARGTLAPPVESRCSTRVVGLAAILLEVVDLDDPIQVGNEVTYEIKVVNQGSAPDANIKLVCTLTDLQDFVSAEGATPMKAKDRTISSDPLARLAPKAEASWRVVVKAAQAGDARFKVELTSDQFQRPIPEDESTRQY